MKRKFKFPYCRCINVNTQTGARMNVNYKIRAVQLDLARQMETMEFLKNFIDFIAEHHYNTLFLYLEWRVRTKTFDIGKKEGYSAEELRELIDYAGTRGIEIIPGLAALGHAELILNQKKFESYAELRNGMHGRFHSTQKHDFCPSHPGMRKFLESYFSEVAAIFPSEYLHVGGDEAWDIGFCPQCAEKAAAYRGEEEIYRDHFTFCHRIVTKKLGKRMMMWDDMFEYYPDILPEMPSDIVMVNWQYQLNVTGYQGHFANLVFSDRLAQYDALGFDYLVAPADYLWSNVESITNYARTHRPLGGLVTTWEKSNALLYKSYPLIAAAGWLWSGSAQDGDDAVTIAAKQIFGVTDELFLQAIRQYVAVVKRVAAPSPANLMSSAFFGPDHQELQANKTMCAILMRYSGKLRDSRTEVVLNDIIDDVILKVLAARAKLAVFQMLNGQESEPVDEIVRELSEAAESRIAACELHRGKEAAQHFRTFFEQACKALLECADTIRKKGILKVLFCLPDTYGAERVRILVRSAGKLIEVASGVFKHENDALFYHNFPLPKNIEVEAVRIEAAGFGGQGVCHVSAKTGKGGFVPAALESAGGIAEHPEHVLTPDTNFCYLGSQRIIDAFHDRTKAEMVNWIEVTMKKVEKH